MAADAVTLIEHDHRVLENLFEQLSSGTGDRRALVTEMSARLHAHTRAEERAVYPAITDADPDEREEIDHAYHEHHEAEHLLRKVENLVESPHFEQALTELVAAVQHHVHEEETEVLPALRRSVDTADLQRLGAAFEQARVQHLRQAGFDPTSTHNAEHVDDPLADATRDELYAMAKAAAIPGRSSMTKDELSEALRAQS